MMAIPTIAHATPTPAFAPVDNPDLDLDFEVCPWLTGSVADEGDPVDVGGEVVEAPVGREDPVEDVVGEEVEELELVEATGLVTLK